MNETAHEDLLVNDDELTFEPDLRESVAPRSQMPPLPRSQMPPPPPRQTPPRVPASSRSWKEPFRDEFLLRPGDVVAGRYRVERLSGRAGALLVAQARHVELGQAYNLKYLAAEGCSLPDATARFLRGARMAMRLQSEYTARTIDAGKLPNGVPYVVTEANQGAELREVLRVRGFLTLTESADFVLQAAESVAEAHACGLVHRGINLSTLFVTRRPDGFAQVKLQDYGVADALRDDPMRVGGFGDGFNLFENPALETLACLSPEQVRGDREVDERSDIWALGAILHHMLSGGPVYVATTLTGLLASIVADAATPITSVRSDVPAAVEALILRCLTKDRNARFASVADLASALHPFASLELSGSVERIARTLGRAGRTLPIGVNPTALVHVGPAPAPVIPLTVSKPSRGVANHPAVWSAALIALGLLGGGAAGALVATGVSRGASAAKEPALAQHINAQRPEPEPVDAPPLQPAPVALPPSSGPRAAQAAAPSVVRKPAVAALPHAEGSVRAAAETRNEKSAPVEKPVARESRATANITADLFDSVR